MTTRHPAGSPSLLRALNARAVLESVHEPATRGDIAAALGLSKPTVAAVLTDLVDHDLMTETGVVSGRKGPAATLYRVARHAYAGLGIDIGAKTLTAAVTDAHGHQHPQVQAPTPRTRRELLRALTALAERARTAADLPGARSEGIVAAVPGVVRADGRTLSYVGLPGHEDLTGPEIATALGDDVVLENDVNLAATIEGCVGAATDVDDFVFIWLGDGVGAGIVLRGELYRGASGGAGEVGALRNPYRMTEPASGGAPGETERIIDEIVGEPYLVTAARRRGARASNAAEVLRLADAGVEAALMALRETATTLAHIAASLTPILDPARIVLGGPLGGASDRLRLMVTEQLELLTTFCPPVVSSQLGPDAVLLGAQHRAAAIARGNAFDLSLRSPAAGTR